MHVKFCSMHTLNLGVSVWAAGGALKLLTEDLEHWQDDTREQRLESAYEDFCIWAKHGKIAQLATGYVAVSYYFLNP